MRALHRISLTWQHLGPLARGVLTAFALGITLSLGVQGLMALTQAGDWHEELRQSLRASAVHLVWVLAVVAGVAVAMRKSR